MRKNALNDALTRNQSELLDDWLKEQLSAFTLRTDLLSEAELRRQSQELLAALSVASKDGNITNLDGSDWAPVRDMLSDLSRSRALLGFSPSETATFVLSLKQPLFARLREETGKDPDALAESIWEATMLLDRMGLLTAEAYIRSREEIISRQQQELMELSTPVVKLWEGILALPLIGTLDSARTQVVMESLLQMIVDTGAEMAIIDITGVPLVDTLVAQHLLRTVAAARLMGADCIISGIRPQIAQTIVHLGVDLANVVTKASLADAFLLALKRKGESIVPAHAAA